MSITIDAIYEAGILKPLVALPELADKSKVRVTIETPAKPVPRVYRTAHETVDNSRENEWLREHQENYRGQWVVLDGKRLVGHTAESDELLALVQRARSEGVEAPFVHRINEDPEPIWMMWS